MSKLMEAKRGLVIGVANERSIAWGAALALDKQGAEICMTYPIHSMKKRLERMPKPMDPEKLFYCNASELDSIDKLVGDVENMWGSIDFLVHSVAFSDKNELTGPYMGVSLENFLNSMQVSCYSLTYLTKKFFPLMKDKGGSIVTMTYYGSIKVIPHYNVMGVCKAALEASVRYLAADLGKYNIRVNSISPGPVRTLASSGIGDMNYIMDWNRYNSPLKRNITTEEIGNTTVFLLSDMSSGITGDIIYVDSGYHTVGMKAIDAPDINKVVQS